MEGCEWVLGGVDHVEISEGFFGLTMIASSNPLTILQNGLRPCLHMKKIVRLSFSSCSMISYELDLEFCSPLSLITDPISVIK